MSHVKRFRWILLAAAALVAQACASRDRWLDCESNLEPINTPAPVVRAEGERSHGKSADPTPKELR